MWLCITDCIRRDIGNALLVGAVLGIIAAVLAAAGGLVIVVATVAIGSIGSAIVAALVVFGTVLAFMVLSCFVGCVTEAQPPAYTGEDREPSLPELPGSDSDAPSRSSEPWWRRWWPS